MKTLELKKAKQVDRLAKQLAGGVNLEILVRDMDEHEAKWLVASIALQVASKYNVPDFLGDVSKTLSKVEFVK